MFKIMGGDGREYGPVSESVIRQWVSEGRANGQSRVAAMGSEQWKTLAEFPEFADLFAPKPAAADAPVPPAAPAIPVPPTPPPPARFRIVGGDGRTYGPVTTDEVFRWLADRRANAQTRAQREGDMDWKTLPEFPEFAAQFGGRVAAPGLPPLRIDRPGGNPSATAVASALVNAPAICLIVINVLAIIAALASLSMGISPAALDSLQGLDPQMQKFFLQATKLNVPANILALLISGFCLFGSISMMNLRHHTVCLVAAVVTLLNCTTCCCGLGLAAGIWALIVLLKPEVREAFH